MSTLFTSIPQADEGDGGDSQATLLIQVHAMSANGVEVHRTRRGKRGSTYLRSGERVTLRVGDALVFLADA